MNRSWLEKDFYKALGVDSTADAATIKRAYRELAQKYHPDANQEEGAEERFKEIGEAYSVLSDEEKRKEYDEVRRLGAAGFGGGFPGGGFGPNGGQRVRVEDLSDLLGGFGGIGDLFGAGSAGGPRRGADQRATINLSFEESVRGTTTEVTVDGAATCRRCTGSGAEPGSQVDVCPTCAGTGTIAQNQGLFSFSQPCPQCQGGGKLITQPCQVCSGSGTERRTRSIKVKIPAGVKDGATIRLAGKGGPGSGGGPRGDLLVRVRVGRHPLFGRRGTDLTLTLPITFTEAALGAKVEVPTLDEPVTLKVPAGTPSGKTFRVRGKGVDRGLGRRGNLLVTVDVVVPENLPRDAKKLLKEFSERYESDDVRENLQVPK